MSKGEITARNHGWSPELLTVLGAMLAIGVGLAGLILNVQAQVREDMRAMEARIHTMETRIREDMAAMEAGIRMDMGAMEARIREDVRELREDVRELRGDVGELRERVSHLEGRFDGGGMPVPRPEESPSPT